MHLTGRWDFWAPVHAGPLTHLGAFLFPPLTSLSPLDRGSDTVLLRIKIFCPLCSLNGSVLGGCLPPPGHCFPTRRGRRISKAGTMIETRQPVSPPVVPGSVSRWRSSLWRGRKRKGTTRGREGLQRHLTEAPAPTRSLTPAP